MGSAILHEVDDTKLFKTDGSTNVRRILNQVLPCCSAKSDFIEEVVGIIDLVSARKNKDSGVPEGHEWKLIVRDADRIEAVGEIGIARCYAYNRKVGTPLFLDSTPRATDVKELWSI